MKIIDYFHHQPSDLGMVVPLAALPKRSGYLPINTNLVFWRVAKDNTRTLMEIASDLYQCALKDGCAGAQFILVVPFPMNRSSYAAELDSLAAMDVYVEEDNDDVLLELVAAAMR